MSIELEYDTYEDKYYVHDLIDGWLTAEITKKDYEYIKKHGLPIELKRYLEWK